MARGFLRLFAIVLGCAALFHAAALVWPALAPSAPPWRHALFVALNAAAAAGVLARPRGFVAAFALLTAQQLVSHGGDAWRAMRDEHRIDVTSIAVVAVMPLALLALVTQSRAESRARRERL